MPKKLEYQELLHSARWQGMRERRFKETWYKCSLCRERKKNLILHHHTYIRVWMERKIDLAVVCRKCHYMIHFDKWVKVNLSKILSRYKILKIMYNNKLWIKQS